MIVISSMTSTLIKIFMSWKCSQGYRQLCITDNVMRLIICYIQKYKHRDYLYLLIRVQIQNPHDNLCVNVGFLITWLITLISIEFKKFSFSNFFFFCLFLFCFVFVLLNLILAFGVSIHIGLVYQYSHHICWQNNNTKESKKR